eukprot:jgi/Hompol1/5875/HPOL_000174-RA
MVLQLKKAHWRQVIIIGCILAVLLVIVPLATVLNNKEGDRKANVLETTHNVPVTAKFNGLLLFGNITAVDPFGLSFKIHFQADPFGSYVLSDSTNTTLYTRLSTSVRLAIAGKETVFKQGSLIASFDSVIPIDDGLANLYPFDAYTTVFDIAAFVDPGT